jgi:hypothetical protein
MTVFRVDLDVAVGNRRFMMRKLGKEILRRID